MPLENKKIRVGKIIVLLQDRAEISLKLPEGFVPRTQKLNGSCFF